MDPGLASLKEVFAHSGIWQRITWEDRKEDQITEELNQLLQAAKKGLLSWDSEGIDGLFRVQRRVTEQFCASLFANVTQLLSIIAYYEQTKEQPIKFLIENRWIPSIERDNFWQLNKYSILIRQEAERRSSSASKLLQALLESAGLVYYHLERSFSLQNSVKKQHWFYEHLHMIRQRLYALEHCHSLSHFCDMTTHLSESLDSLVSQYSFEESVEKLLQVYQKIPLIDSALRKLYASLEKPGFLYRKVLYPLLHYSWFMLPFIRFFHRCFRKSWIEIYEDGKGIWMSMISFLKQHMIDPLSSIYQELFHNRYMSMDASVVDQSREAVLKMVESLVSYPIPKNRETIALLQIYEKNIRHPWYSLAFGDLLQVLLIQLQKLKVDVEEQMLTLNQLVRSNEINFQLLAAIPGFLILYFSYHMLHSLYNAWRYQQIHGMQTPARQVKWWLLAIQQCYARLNENPKETSAFYQIYGTAYYYCYAIEWLVQQQNWISFSSVTTRKAFLRDLEQLCSAECSITLKAVLVQQMLSSYRFLQVYFT
ncbi:hypothetical protein GpartN1_g3786.t1 [Galdieria partita]|uniref:Uncharacterized protein n=1 Tax=Galdieria partita TaxID=83374 RepID=A0A9C7UQV3_9RHOD|nr:hypothetical protein GpartN1_g3786.t1 [Galdieria partita]